jgi:Rrf2 family protein
MISRTGMHAVTALIALAELGAMEFAGAGEVADQVGAPRNYLGKLLKALADQGLLESQKGKGGGFRLARHPARVSLYDVVEPIERVSRWNGCFLGQGRCSDETPCLVHQRWKRVRDSYLHFLQETTLADLADLSRRSQRKPHAGS